jgi:hypothetical protein
MVPHLAVLISDSRLRLRDLTGPGQRCRFCQVKRVG